MASQVFNLSQFMRGRLDVWEDEINQSENTSTVHARIVVYRENSWSGQTYDNSVYIKLQIGTIVVDEGTRTVSHNKSMGEIVVAEGAITATHNSSGGGSRDVFAKLYSNITANFRGEVAMTFELANTGGGTPPPPPVTQNNPTLSSSSISMPSSSSLTVYSNAPNSNYKHSVEFREGEGQPILLEDGMFNSSCYFSSSKLRSAFLGKLQYINPLALVVTMKTYYNGNYVGQASTNLTIRFNNNTPPNPADFTVRDSNPDTQHFSDVAGKTVFIQGESNLVVDIPSSSKGSSNYGIRIRNYSASVGNITRSVDYSSNDVSIDMGKLDSNGTKPITLITYDENYSSALRTKDIEIISYHKPIIRAIAERINIDSNDVILRINSLYSPINIDGKVQNIINPETGIKWRYKESSAEQFNEWQNRKATLGSNGDISTADTADLALTLDKNKDYLFEVEVSDSIHTVKAAFNASIGVPKVWIGEDGRNAVGGLPVKPMKPTDTATLEVYGTIYSNGKEVAVKEEESGGGNATTSCPYEIGDIYITTNPAYSTAQAVSERWKGTSWERYAQGRTLVGYDSSQGEFNSVNKTGGAKAVALSESQMPRHSHKLAFSSANGDEVTISCTNNGRDVLNIESWAWKRNSEGGNVYATPQGHGAAHNNLQPYITTYMWRRIS